MKILQMKSDDVKYMMDVLKLSADKTKSKSVWEMIHCKVNDGRITATSIDGYRLHQVTLPCEVIEGNFDKSFLLPITKVPTKSTLSRIEISEDEVLYDFLTEKQIHKINHGDYPKIDELIMKDEPKFAIYVNPKFMKDAFDAFKGDKAVKIEFRGETNPIIVKRENQDFAYVLPMKSKKQY